MEIKEETKSDDLVKDTQGKEIRKRGIIETSELYATGAQISSISKREKTTSAIRPKYTNLLLLTFADLFLLLGPLFHGMKQTQTPPCTT